jgi:hypothetical protein
MKPARYFFSSLLLPLLLGAPLLACGQDDDGDSSTEDGDGDDGAEESADPELDPQVPPADATQMVQWLAQWESQGWEAGWVCETAPTAKTEGAAAIHVHNDADGKNRVCNNERLAAASPGEPVPAGSAALKFVGEKIYVEVKTAADSAGGDNWYWYAPGGSPEGKGIDVCVGCHSAAGADADHPGLGDYVYFQVE